MRSSRNNAAFNAWWGGTVTVGREATRAPSRKKTVVTAERQQLISVAKATKKTGITKQQVSKWAHQFDISVNCATIGLSDCWLL
jgi:hypothetical protein